MSTLHLLSVLGLLESMRLAIPGVACWSRALYTPWKGLGPQHVIGGPAKQIPASCVAADEMVEELAVLRTLLRKGKGAPLMKRSLDLTPAKEDGELLSCNHVLRDCLKKA